MERETAQLALVCQPRLTNRTDMLSTGEEVELLQDVRTRDDGGSHAGG